MALLFRMIQSVKSEAAKSEDMLVQLQEILESVRLAFLNCFLDFAGMVNGHCSLFILQKFTSILVGNCDLFACINQVI